MAKQYPSTVFPCVIYRSKKDNSLSVVITITSEDKLEIPLFGQHEQYLREHYDFAAAEHQDFETLEALKLTAKTALTPTPTPATAPEKETTP